MLRGLVLLFALLNVALFFWIRSEPPSLQADREPQRLERQVAPNAIQVLPDVPTAANSRTPGDAGNPGGTGDSPAAAPAPGGAASTDALAHKTAAVEAACAESEPLTAAQWTTLAQALARAGVREADIVERRQQRPGRWMVYMGRFADEQQWQHKADELKRLGLKFDRISTPPGLDPGLSLGNFASADDAGAKLDELGRHGVHTARVVEAAPPTEVRRMQVRAADDGWRKAVAGQRFSACPPAGAPATTTAASL